MDDDLNNDLLALAEMGDQHMASDDKKQSKRTKRASSDDSDMEMDSDASSDLEVPQNHSKPALSKSKRSSAKKGNFTPKDEDATEDEENINPFPLNGIYFNEQDRERLLALPVLQREEELSARQEEIARRREARDLAKMAADARRGMAASQPGGGRSTGRAKVATGTTSTKAKKLEELKSERISKANRRRHGSDDEDDETYGESTRKRRKGEKSPSEQSDFDDDSKQQSLKRQTEENVSSDVKLATLESLVPITVPRNKCMEYWGLSWFTDFMKGAFVRLLIGEDKSGKPDYRLLPVLDVVNRPEKRYALGQETTDYYVLLPGNDGSPIPMPMDKISNSRPTERDYAFFADMVRRKVIKAIGEKDVATKKIIVDQYRKHVMTEADVTALINRRAVKKRSGKYMAILALRREAAVANNDTEELERIDKELGSFSTKPISSNSPASTTNTSTNSPKAAPPVSPSKRPNPTPTRPPPPTAQKSFSVPRKPDFKSASPMGTRTPESRNSPAPAKLKISSKSSTDASANIKEDQKSSFDELVASQVALEIDI